MGSTFVLQLSLPCSMEIAGRRLDREEFFAWLWKRYGDQGLLGVHEGTLLSEQAAEQGFETESFTVDAAEAPRARDWIAAQGEARAEVYFASSGEARAARGELLEQLGVEAGSGIVGEITEQAPQDWNAEWKKTFLNASEGVALQPFWRILPAWVGEELATGMRKLDPGERALLINPGAGFGTGTHETTQLCLQSIGEFALAQAAAEGAAERAMERAAFEAGAEPLGGLSVLDFGSGSGILAIGAALLGAHVAAVEVDELAVDNARENARINGVEERIEFSRELAGADYPLVIANILRPVLIQFASELTSRLESGGCLILSGLVAGDVAEVERVYSALLGRKPRILESGEWRAVVWDALGFG